MKKIMSLVLSTALLTSGIAPAYAANTNLPKTNPISSSVRLSSVKMSKSSIAMIKGKGYTLSVKGTSKKPTWTSSNKNVATVSSKGTVTAKNNGTAIIRAKIGSKTYSCKVTVVPASLSSTEAQIEAGETVTLKIKGAGSHTVYWTTSSDDIATVTSAGVVKGISDGDAVITARIGVSKLRCTVTVTPKKQDTQPEQKPEQKPDTQPEQKPSTDKPTTDAPTTDKPTTDKPTTDKPTGKPNVPADHEHTYGEGRIIREPSCVSNGSKEYDCTVCGEPKYETIPRTKDDHKFGEPQITQPTCTTDGVKTEKCTVCGYRKTEKIPATGHAWDEGKQSGEYVIDEEESDEKKPLRTRIYFCCTACRAAKREGFIDDFQKYYADTKYDGKQNGDACLDHISTCEWNKYYFDNGVSYGMMNGEDLIFQTIRHDEKGHYKTVYTCTKCGETKTE